MKASVDNLRMDPRAPADDNARRSSVNGGDHLVLEAATVKHLLKAEGRSEEEASAVAEEIRRQALKGTEASEKSHGHGHGGPLTSRARLAAFAALSFSSLGAVFGDLGTSPLYSFASLFQDQFGNQGVPNEDDVRGGLACMVWALVLCSTLKYQLFMMSAGFQGEGGTFAMLNALKWRGGLQHRPHLWRLFQGLAVLAVGLVTIDAILTSTVSVSSAVEGIGLAAPQFNGLADPTAFRTTNVVSAAILCGVFALQSVGSGRIGFIYAPVMLAWLCFIAAAGGINIAKHPSVLSAWSPAQLWRFWTVGRFRGAAAWRSLGGVVLCLTGSEALYADMGHFGRGPIAAAWFFCVFPALILCYTGQSAYLLGHLSELAPDPAHGPECAAAWYGGVGAACAGGLAGSECCARFTEAQSVIANTFWRSLPGKQAYQAMLVVATLASIVGSQSVITGAFSMFSQTASLGIFPAIEVVQTSTSHEGQVFCPGINRLMFGLVLVVLGSFQHSSNLTSVFGACVASAFLVDSLLRLGVAACVQRWRWPALLAVGGPLLLMDGALFTANVARYFTAGPVLLGEGDALGRSSWIAYIPLIIEVLLSTLMFNWIWGRRALLLDAAKRTATLLALGVALSQQDTRAMRLEDALAFIRAPGVLDSLLEQQQQAGGGLGTLAEGGGGGTGAGAENAEHRETGAAAAAAGALPPAPPAVVESFRAGGLKRGGASSSTSDASQATGGFRRVVSFVEEAAPPPAPAALPSAGTIGGRGSVASSSFTTGGMGGRSRSFVDLHTGAASVGPSTSLALSRGRGSFLAGSFGGDSAADGGRPARRTHSFQASFQLAGVAFAGAVDDAVTHAALGNALAALAAAGSLVRTPCAGVFLSSPASLLDTEPLPPPNEAAGIAPGGGNAAPSRRGSETSSACASFVASGPPAASPTSDAAASTPAEVVVAAPVVEEEAKAVTPLELPHAFLHAVMNEAALPRLSVVLAVEFTAGAAFASRRVRVRRIAPADGGRARLPGVFHVTIAFGWAERPRDSEVRGGGGAIADALAALGRAAAEPGSSCPELAALQHVHCWARQGEPCLCCSSGGGGGGPIAATFPSPPLVGARECLPGEFIVSRFALRAPPTAPAPRRWAAGLFNLIAGVFGTSADLVKLPTASVVEVSTPVILPDRGTASTDSGSPKERAAWVAQAKARARGVAARLRMAKMAAGGGTQV